MHYAGVRHNETKDTLASQTHVSRELKIGIRDILVAIRDTLMMTKRNILIMTVEVLGTVCNEQQNR